MDSITKITLDDAGALVMSASHGGASSGEFALEVPLGVVFFNDAGVGKDRASTAALDMLEAKRVAAGADAHTSACIGDSHDSRDMWEHGVISHVNASARKLGLIPGSSLREALTTLVNRSCGVA